MSTSSNISVVEPKNLYLFRGLPGSGKTSVAEALVTHTVSADEFFDLFYGGQFDANKLGKAHKWCRESTQRWMQQQVGSIGVHNTFTRIREMRDYFELAHRYNYRVHTIIVENRHENESVHGVPEETLDRMERRFDVKIR